MRPFYSALDVLLIKKCQDSIRADRFSDIEKSKAAILPRPAVGGVDTRRESGIED
jgi:hypothetical protein